MLLQQLDLHVLSLPNMKRTKRGFDLVQHAIIPSGQWKKNKDG